MDKATQTDRQPNKDSHDKKHDEITKCNDNKGTQPDTQKQFVIPRFPYRSNENYYKYRVYDTYDIS